VVAAALIFIPLGFRAVRNLAAFQLLLAPAISRLLAARDRASGPAVARPAADAPAAADTPAANARVVAIVGALAAAGVGAAWALPLSFLNWQPISAGAAAAVRDCPGRLFNQYNAGGPLIWFVPEKPVFVDGRQDPYPPAFLQRARAADTDDRQRRALFAEYDIGCAALRLESPIWTHLAGDGWRERFRDRQWVVLSKP
jgi:hypothetical protein